MQQVILVTGASGFIGSYLLPFLVQKGYQIIALSRQPRAKTAQVTWVTDLQQIQTQKIDYVINLAGESIGAGRWSSARKQRLIASRVETTQALYAYLIQHNIQPKLIISGSAVGFYGIDLEENWQHACSETSSSQANFMSELCQRWEESALQFGQFNTKIIRLGVVFAQHGGILAQMLKPIQMNLVGKIGHGRQPVTWVHIQDVLAAINFLLTTTSTEKVFNVVAPDMSSQAEFVKHAAACWQKKPYFSAPSILFKYLLGEQSLLILNGQYVVPKNLIAAGFVFEYPSLPAALQHLRHQKTGQ